MFVCLYWLCLFVYFASSQAFRFTFCHCWPLFRPTSAKQQVTKAKFVQNILSNQSKSLSYTKLPSRCPKYVLSIIFIIQMKMWKWRVPSASASSEMSSSPEGANNSALVKQCLEFCQTLASMGQTINLSLSIGSNFSFSLNTNKDITILESRKAETERTVVKEVRKLTPSARKRNQKKRGRILEKEICTFCGGLWLQCSWEGLI